MSRGIGSKVSESGTYTGVDVLTMMLGMIELHTRVVLKVAQETIDRGVQGQITRLALSFDLLTSSYKQRQARELIGKTNLMDRVSSGCWVSLYRHLKEIRVLKERMNEPTEFICFVFF